MQTSHPKKNNKENLCFNELCHLNIFTPLCKQTKKHVFSGDTMMMNEAQWYYNNVTPVSGMDSQDDVGYGIEEDDQRQQETPVYDERDSVMSSSGRRRREHASELFTVPHPDNKNLRVVYRYDGGRAKQGGGGDSSSSFSPGPVSAGARMSGSGGREPPSTTTTRKKKPQQKAGSPKKQKTEPPSTVLEIENRVLKDVIARQQQQQQQQASAVDNSTTTTTPPQQSSPSGSSNIGKDFQSVPSFSVGGGAGANKPVTGEPTGDSSFPNYGGMYDISKNPKESVHVFLHDWFTGTPYDKFDFGAMKRHLVRKAEMLADPVIKFVANVAPQCGTSLERLLVSNAVYEGANNMRELVQKSALNQELLSVLLALVLNEMLGGGGGRGGGGSSVVINASEKEQQDNDEGELVPLSQEPFVKEEKTMTKEEPTNTTEAMINVCMWDEVSRAHTMLKRHADGHPLPCQTSLHDVDPFDPPSSASPDLIGVDGFRSLVQGPPLPGHNPIFADLMSILDYSLRAPNIARWNWNNLPENVGMALVKPEVVAMIEATYEEIRAIGPVQSKFTLAHLMTSPRIRQKFAMMVAAAINIVPSELQYPNAAPVRGNGSISDRRITMGAMKEFRETLVYQSNRRYFQHVAYAESSAWKDANATVKDLEHNLESMRARMWTLIRDLKTKLGVDNDNARIAKDNLAHSLGLLDTGTEYYKAVLTAYRVMRVFEQARTRRDNAVAKLTALSINDVGYGAKKASLESEIQAAVTELEYAKVHLGVVRGVISDQGRANVWKKHFGSRLSVVVVPFLSHQALDTDYNGVQVQVPENVGLLNTPQIDMTKVESAVAALVDALKQDMANVNGWNENRSVASLLYDVHAVATQCLQAIRSYGSASVRYTNALTDVYSMTDEEKRELVYIPPSAMEIPPVRDFLYSSRSNAGANMFI